MRKMRRAIFDGRLHPQFKCDYIRVLDEGNQTRLSSKIHAKESGQMSDQKEIEVIVNDFGRTVEIIKSMGLEPAIEIEGESEEKVKQVAMDLELDWNSRMITSRVELYMKAYGFDEEETLRRMSHLTFEHNPFT